MRHAYAPARSSTTSGGSTLRLVRYSPAWRQGPHAHERDAVSMVLRGGLEERAGRRAETAGPLDVVIKPAGVVHSDAYGPEGAVLIQLSVSPGDAAASEASAKVIGAWRWVREPCASCALLRLLPALMRRPQDPARGRESLDDLVIESLASLTAAPVRAVRKPPPWLERARERLHETPTSIRAASLEAGVHPVHLAREFRRHFGTTPSGYRRAARWARATELLLAGRLPLCAIALEAGYADQPHMTRDLRSASGLTPASLRSFASGL